MAGSSDRLDFVADPVEFAHTALETAERLDDGALSVAYWSYEHWQTLETQELAEDQLMYLCTIRPYALDPIGAPLLIPADQITAALLRGLLIEGES